MTLSYTTAEVLITQWQGLPFQRQGLCNVLLQTAHVQTWSAGIRSGAVTGSKSPAMTSFSRNVPLYAASTTQSTKHS